MSIKTNLSARAGFAPLLAFAMALAMLFLADSIANAQAAPPSPTPPALPAPTQDPTPPIPLPPSPTPPNLMPAGGLKGNPSTSLQLAYNPQADLISDAVRQRDLNAEPAKPVGSTPKSWPLQPSAPPPAGIPRTLAH